MKYQWVVFFTSGVFHYDLFLPSLVLPSQYNLKKLTEKRQFRKSVNNNLPVVLMEKMGNRDEKSTNDGSQHSSDNIDVGILLTKKPNVRQVAFFLFWVNCFVQEIVYA